MEDIENIKNNLEEHLLNVDGVIIELKKEYFSKKVPLNDDETLVHKLCLRLENVLRYGAREKYTFKGVRKDYWNYINDCIPKDETVKFILSISDIKTNQGKGRAFLRQALMEKSLADTLQRCSINERMTKEYYLTDSIFRNDQLLKNFIHSLYDLNAVDFQLPHQGYDLDRGFPSFSRKSFEEKRTMSTASEQDIIPADPVEILNKNVDDIVSIVTSWIGVENPSAGENTEISLLNVINKVTMLGEDVTKIKALLSKEIETLTQTVAELKGENMKIVADSELRIKQLNERFSKLQNAAVASDKAKELYDKLITTELKLTETESKYNILEQESNSLKRQLELTLLEYESIKREKNELTNSMHQLTAEMTRQKHHEHSIDCAIKILEDKLMEVQKNTDLLESQSKELNERLLGKESIVEEKEKQFAVLQDALAKSTGLLVGSLTELKDTLNIQLKDKIDKLKDRVDILQNVTVNEDLSKEAKSLQKENIRLEEEKKDLEISIQDITKKNDDAEKMVPELQIKLTEESNALPNLLQFVSELSNVLYQSDVNTDVEDGLDKEDGLLKKKKKKLQLQNSLTKVSLQDEQEAALKKVLEMQQELLDLKTEKTENEKEIVQLKSELQSVTNSFKELQDSRAGNKLQKTTAEKKCEDLEDEISKLNVEVDKYNGEIYNLSLEISKLNVEVILKEEEAKGAQENLGKLEATWKELKDEKLQIEQKYTSALSELSVATTNLDELKKKLDNLSAQNHDLKIQLENKDAKEISMEKELQFSRKESENAIVLKNEEIRSLKFQLSTEELKKENFLKEISNIKTAKQELMQQLAEREEKLKSLANEQLHHKTTLAVENETLAEENIKMKKELSILTEKYEIAEKEIAFLKVQVAKLAKEKDEEKATRINGWNRLNNLIEEKKETEEKLKNEIKQLNEDINELKNHLINLTKDKHDLWTQKDQMEFELKQRLDERWVKDEEVTKCTNCQETFSLTLRKHHCRLCGHIFCHECSNKWLSTQHSKKKVRACNVCADTYVETHAGSDAVDGGSEKGSFISSDQMSITDESFEEYRKNQMIAPKEEDEKHTLSISPIDNEDPFVMLDPSDVNSSGSFGPSEQISIRPSDLKLATILPTVIETGKENTAIKENVVIQVPAGLRSLLPVVIGNSKCELMWQFNSTLQDVGFGIAYKENENADDETIQTCFPLSRYISHKQDIHGRMKIEKSGVYYLIFNNSYSRLTSKTVFCSVGLIPSKN